MDPTPARTASAKGLARINQSITTQHCLWRFFLPEIQLVKRNVIDVGGLCLLVVLSVR